MNIIYRLIVIISLLFLINCSGKKKEPVIINSNTLEEQMIEAYNKGVKALDEGDVLFAAKNFNAVENLYPQSVWAPKSILMAAYSFYSQDYYGDAISELSRYLKNYPVNENTAYAYFLLATCYYELIIDEKKDLSPLLKSKRNFQIILDEYPNTDFALDAKFKLLLIDNILASKELYIGKYYLKKEKWIPAINRFKNIMQNYNDTDYVLEATHRLVEVYYKIGLEDEAKKYAITLGYNYQSSEWYERSYKIFNTQYVSQKEKIKKDKENIILKKFRELF